jgi:hypothetical protein
MRMNGTKLKTRTQTHTGKVFVFFTKEPKICVGEKISSLTNFCGKTGCPHGED